MLEQKENFEIINISSDDDIAGKDFTDSIISISSTVNIRKSKTSIDNCIIKLSSKGDSCINLQDGTIEIKNSRFETDGKTKDGFIRVKNSYLTIEDSQLQDLVFTEVGESYDSKKTCFIYIDGENSTSEDAKIEITNCQISKCTGHVINSWGYGIIHIQNCFIKDHIGCLAEISNNQQGNDISFIVSDSKFENCIGATCSSDEEEPKRQSENPFSMLGEAMSGMFSGFSKSDRVNDYLINSDSSCFCIKNCSFKKIRGGIVIQSSNAYPRGTSTIEACSFKNVYFGKKTIDDNDEIFQEGKIINIGVTSTDINVSDCTFENVGTMQFGSLGDFSSASKSDVSNCTFERLLGKIVLEGGAIRACRFTDCHAFWRERSAVLDTMGGNSLIMLHGSNQSSNRIKGRVSNCSFQDCTAGDYIIEPKSYLGKTGLCVDITDNSFLDCETLSNDMYRVYDQTPKTIGSGFKQILIANDDNNQVTYSE